MTRQQLKDRRASYTKVVKWAAPGGQDHKLHVTYGVDEHFRISEAFCAGFRADQQICALANDACILLSRLLQYGETIEDLASKLGEDIAEGSSSGPPSSIIGMIARVGAELQQEFNRELTNAVTSEPVSAE